MGKTLSEIKDNLPADRREKIQQRTTDLIEELRDAYGDNEGLCFVASDEIERLRAELDQEKQHSRSVERRLNEVLGYLAEAERLLSDPSLFIVPDEGWQDKRDAFLAGTTESESDA